MTQRTTFVGLLVIALTAGCSSKQDEAEKKTATPATGTAPLAPKTQPIAPKTTPPSVAKALVPLATDPGSNTGTALWSKKIGSLGQDAARAVAIDEQGNVAVTGYVATGADFGDGKAVETKDLDAFVAKYGPDGTLAWAVTFGGKGEDVGNGVTFDGSGNVIVVGLFASEMQVGESKLASQGSDDVFFAKFSPDGAPLWARMFGGNDSDVAYDVAARPNGNLLVTGSFQGTVLRPAPDEPMTSKGNEDIYILELDPRGGLIWVQSYGAAMKDFGQRVALDPVGNVVVYGEYGGDVSFGGPSLPSEGNQDLFLLKLDPSGKHLWSQRFGGVFNELGLGLGVDPSGNIAITGSFDNEIAFGPDKLTSQGESDVFVAKFNQDGSYAWSKAFGGPREDIGYGLGMDKYGNIVLGGWFWQSVDFGAGQIAAAGQNKDAFLLKLSAGGEHVWSMRMGDKDHDQVRGVSVNAEGRVAVAGLFRFTLNLDPGPLESTRKPDDMAPPPDVFVALFAR
jgi:hypothetical protein